MAKPGRPSKITPAVGAKIAEYTSRGMNPSQICRALKAAGTPLSLRTIRRRLVASGAPTGLAEPSAAPAPLAFEPSGQTSFDAAAGAALLSDDLQAIEKTCAEVEAAMRQWSTGIGFDPTSTRAYAQLARLAADLRTRMAALRPRPEVEREHFAELGAAARATLTARIIANAEQDYRAQAVRAMALLEAR